MELNDLLNYDLKIYQYKDSFKFSIDSVLLAEFVNINFRNTKIIENLDSVKALIIKAYDFNTAKDDLAKTQAELSICIQKEKVWYTVKTVKLI